MCMIIPPSGSASVGWPFAHVSATPVCVASQFDPFRTWKLLGSRVEPCVNNLVMIASCNYQI